MVGTHSGIITTSKQNYLYGGTLSLLMREFHHHVDTGTIHKDVLGRWSATTIKRNNTDIFFINVYHIPESTNVGPTKSFNQYNEKLGVVKDTSHYREKLLDDIVQYVHTRIDIDDIIVTGDLNQSLDHN